MKKLITTMFAVAIIFSSCSKEHKLNKRLDGEWRVTFWGGGAIVSPASMTYTFDRDKKGKGTYTWAYTNGTYFFDGSGIYDLEKDDKMTFIEDGRTHIMKVIEYSKKTLTIVDVATDDDIVMEKK